MPPFVHLAWGTHNTRGLQLCISSGHHSFQRVQGTSYNLVTDHTNAPGTPPSAATPCTRECPTVKTASTFTVPFSNTSPSHSAVQLSTSWHHIGSVRQRPGGTSRSPFFERPACRPNMTEPGSGESSAASLRASVACCASLKRWKKDDVWIAEMCPSSGVRVPASLRVDGVGRGVEGAE